MRAFRIPCALLAVAAVVLLWWGWHSRFPSSTPVQAAATARVQPGEDRLDYSAAFEAEVKRIGQITPQEFAQRFGGQGKHLDRLSWDPTTARYWEQFNLNPNLKGQQVRVRGAEERERREWASKLGQPLPEKQPVLQETVGLSDFRLNEAELGKFKQNGFVVSERMGAPSCTEMFYRIYQRDLPVIVTTDAILHAWHRSYDAILEEVETSCLIPALDEILAGMAAKIPEARQRYGAGPLRDRLEDTDFYLAVSRSLLAGGPVPSALEQDDKVRDAVAACEALGLRKYKLFGKVRDVDFSQFKPRGHYEKSDQLRRYFKAMMWLGRIDLRVAGNPKEASPPQLAAAVVLHDLLRQSGKFERWQQFDRILQTFVGRADSMTFAQLGIVLDAAGVRSPADVADAAAITRLQKRIDAGKFGAQEIRGDVFWVDPYDPKKFVLPRSFTFLGQRFAVDSWVTAKVVFDDILWDDEKVNRRIPSCLDVGFAVFGNDHAVPLLTERLNNPHGRRFRDGLPYQHNLAALRTIIDRQPVASWQENLYTGWLGSLRELSQPTTDAKYPEAMRTPAWGMKTLNTQLASWTQLRHDTILYVKQSYTVGVSCYYPAGYVEPVPVFWSRMAGMAQRAADLIEKTPYPQPVAREKHVKFLRNFADKMATLRQIAEKELAQQELSKEETKFLEDVIEVYHVRMGCFAERHYAGWYPGLFYLGGEDSTKWDALVADVHTDTPDKFQGDPGCVLHQAVGSVDLLMIAVDNGKDRMVYAGPVLSHYEFEMPPFTRKSDSEWKADLHAGRMPPRPEWTHGYLVPGENIAVKHYQAD